MPLYQPKELLAFLTSLGVRPKKGLSQNFLVDGNVLKNVLKEAAVSQDDLILEIGPGPGALTEQLLAAGASVIAVEKDRVYAKELRRLEPDESRLTIYEADALKVDFKELIERHPKKRPVKVIANLPYHITTPIVEQLVLQRECFLGLWVMVQEEVARRFAASHGNKDYSSWTIFLNLYTQVRYCFLVRRQCFYPAPKVDSAIVELLFKKEVMDYPEGLLSLIRLSFQQRRKMLLSSLSKSYDKERLRKALAEMGFDEKARPEELSWQRFIELFERYEKLGESLSTI
ncbi:MAG: rsmA [Chlamydiales bacterium]|jgi:16S rRNA (adenine1518-N6/adenine1519-N6)-dimethyltransferase|nr:rsmA [Chlamydiales bacterium]